MLTLSVRFRWVACQLDSLGDCFDLLHLRQALESLPKTLDDTYARILCNIDNHNHYSRQILRILQWLSFSVRPLQLKEVAEIVAIDVDETPRFDPQRRLLELRDILTMCSSLITLTSNMHNTSKEEETGSEPNVGFPDPEGDYEANNPVSEDVKTYVRLAHFSVKEYLVSDRIQHGTASYYSIREIESHGVLAEDCIAYLLQFDEPGSLTFVTLDLSPLAQYAAKFWRKHARFAEEGLIKSTTLLGVELLTAEGEAFLNWIRIDEACVDKQPRYLGTPLYYASEAGLLELVRMLIERGMDVNAQAGIYGYALQAASYKGHIDVVHLLLANEADVNAQGGYHGNALQAAASIDAENIMKLLFKHGADVNAVGGAYGTALIGACDCGSGNAVKLLLDKGADVNVLGDDLDGSALYIASENGYENIVKLLLENGADVNALGDGSWGSALYAASKRGHENVVKLLLEKGADVNALGGYWGSALQIASRIGYENIVKLLLENGVDVNALGDGSRGSALYLASEYGHENIVKMLEAKGAVNVKPKKKRSEAEQENDPPVEHVGEPHPTEALPTHSDVLPALE